MLDFQKQLCLYFLKYRVRITRKKIYISLSETALIIIMWNTFALTSMTTFESRLNREGQTIIFRLRSGHNRLKQYMHTKFKIGTSPYCPCGNIAQTAEHILQDCPLHAELRQHTWPKPSTLDDKLNGTEYNLTQTVEFIKATGLQI